MSGKSSKSKIVKLRLSPERLAQFPSDLPAQTKPRSKSSSSASTSTPSNPTVVPSPAPAPSDSAATPATVGTPSNAAFLAPPPTNPHRRKGVPGPKPGMKRGASQLDISGPPKPRGKPGPKKKIKIGENGEVKTTFGGVAPITTTKLNPKANQGAINANLRALDRTGKPCRKWAKRGFQVKSFTGVQWDVPTWRAPQRTGLDADGEVKSDTSSSSDLKHLESSALASEKSNSGGDQDTPMPPLDVTSSPSRVVPAAA